MNAVAEIAKLLLTLAPEVIKDIQMAMPLAKSIVDVVKKPDAQVTQNQWDAIHEQIDSLTADIELPL